MKEAVTVLKAAVSAFALIGMVLLASCGDGGGGGGGKAAFVGNWVYYDGKDDADKIELFKDGTGTVDGEKSVSWKIENNRLVISSERFGMSCNYDISDNELILINDNGDSAIFVRNESAKAFYKTGLNEKNNGNDDNAIAGFTEAIRLDTNFAKAYTGRAGAYLAKKDYDNAIADYTKAMRLTPDAKDGYAGRAEAYLAKEDYDNAIADYTEVIHSNPNDMPVYLARVEAYSHKKDYEKVIADLELILQKASSAADEEEFVIAEGEKISKKEFIKVINERLEKNNILNIDPRLIGLWDIGKNVENTCWEFKNNGTGYSCECGCIRFKFTTANGRVKFSNGRICEEEGCFDKKLDDLIFSFSNDGKTLILGKETLKKKDRCISCS